MLFWPEPSPRWCRSSARSAFEEMPLGAIATNGLKVIPAPSTIESISPSGETTKPACESEMPEDMLLRQIENYRGDPRAVFVYTFTRDNIDQVREVAESLCQNGCRLTFNVFSAPVGYDGPLRHTPESLAQTRKTMIDLLVSLSGACALLPLLLPWPIRIERVCMIFIPVPIRG